MQSAVFAFLSNALFSSILLHTNIAARISSPMTDLTHLENAYRLPKGLRYDSKDGTLHIRITVDEQWKSITPPYASLKSAVEIQYPYAPIVISMVSTYRSRPPTEITHKLCKYLDLLRYTYARWTGMTLDATFISPALAILGDKALYYPGKALQNINLLSCGDVPDTKPMRNFVSLFCDPYHWPSDRRRFNLMIQEGKPVIDLKTFGDLLYPRITSLTVTSTICKTSVIELLSAAVNLEHAVFSSITVTEKRIPRGICVYSEKLQSLTLANDEFDFSEDRDTCALYSVLRRLSTPNLTELCLGYEDLWPADDIKKFVKTIAPGIRTLQLIKLGICAEDIEELLVLMPRLTHLFVDATLTLEKGKPSYTQFTEKFIERFMVTPDRACDHTILCPILQKLSVSVTCMPRDMSTFRQMVLNRFQCSILREINITDAHELPGADLAAYAEFQRKYGLKVNLYSRDLPHWLMLR